MAGGFKADLPASFTTASAAASQRAAPRPGRDQDAGKLRAAAQEFEAVFMSQMLETMFQGIRTDGPFGGGHGESVYRSLLLQEYGKVLARRGGIGLADAVTRQMIATQEAK
jgi:Rod binding domain-containing protein